MLYHVHFAAEPDAPVPLVDELVAVEADTPEQAASLLVESGRVPQDQPLNWAHVVVAVHPNGRPKLVMRYPLTPEKITVAWTPPSCEDRTRQLHALRQRNPQRLIAAYRAATDRPEPLQLPRGLGFTGMIEAILQHEFATNTEQDEFAAGEVLDESQKITQVLGEPANNFVVLPQRPPAHMTEFRAFCQGGAMVLAGLLLAVLYCFAQSSGS